MKKLTLLLLALICTVHSFGQKKDDNKRRSFSITSFYHKNIVYQDTVGYDIEYIGTPENADSVSIKRMKSRTSFADAVSKPNQFTFDSIPEISSINLNGIYFESKRILSKVSNYDIIFIKKDSTYSFRYDLKTKEYTGAARYKKPHTAIYQNHLNLPHDFLFFKQYTLEPIRYSCSSYSPVLDVFHTEDSIVAYAKPRVMVDGRLQPKAFDYQNIDLENVKQIDVFAKEDAGNYFGYKAKSGLISIMTKSGNFNLNLTLSNTHVVGEMQDKNGNWTIIKDTLLTNINEFREFRKAVYATNGPVYLINGEFEDEKVNRKTIDTDAIEAIEIVGGAKINVKNPTLEERRNPKYTNDTVRIKTQKERWTSKANVGIPSIMSQIKRLRNTDPEPTPIYIVDNQEITAEKLKEFKNKELEFVQSLEGCDAITKYGKRAEFGVVIYRKRG